MEFANTFELSFWGVLEYSYMVWCLIESLLLHSFGPVQIAVYLALGENAIGYLNPLS